MPQKLKKNRGRPSGKQEKTVLFKYRNWTLKRFDSLNISLTKKGEDPNRTRYYSTLGSAMHGLAKEIGFSSPDLNAAIESWDELAVKISALAL